MKWWYQKHFPCGIAWLLMLLSLPYRGIIFFRKKLYQWNIFCNYKAKVPVIVVGNITVGGTGKTPIVIFLAEQLKKSGFHPGIVSRGYGSKAPYYPFSVCANTSPKEGGDEPVLLAINTACPLFIDSNRPRAIKALLSAHPECNIIISDDGLQHLAMHRDIEIAVMDGTRGLGNGFCLPAGPLREPASRLSSVDFVLLNDSSGEKIPPNPPLQRGERILRGRHSRLPLRHSRVPFRHSRVGGNPFTLSFKLKPAGFYSLNTNLSKANLDFSNPIHAVTGIGNPDRFFDTLKAQGLTIIPHVFPDHHPFARKDFEKLNLLDKTVIMTEKDAVKCRQWLTPEIQHWYYLKVTAIFNENNLFLEPLRFLIQTSCSSTI